jgi:hypothetical protein
MRTKYHWTQILVRHPFMKCSSENQDLLMTGSIFSQGIFICLCGLALTVSSDFITDKNWPALNKGKGDGFMILGATLYGFSQYYSTLFAHSSPRGLTNIVANALEEFFVRKSPLYEVIGPATFF